MIVTTPTAASAIPITIVGGYLGAGKTTLVNHLLRHADGLRLGVLVNEFGELPIDRDLIEAETDNVIAIAGGCVCCSYGNDLIFAMTELAAIDPPVDHVVLEASGVGIPNAIAATVGLMQSYVHDGVVVLADAETIKTATADRYMGDTVRAQLQDADIIILNKADLVSGGELKNTDDWLRTLAPQARMVTATRAMVAPSVVLQSFVDRDRVPASITQPADAQYQSVRLPASEPIAPEVLAQSLIDDGFVRAKGFVPALDGRLATVQVVGRRWEISDAPEGVTPGIVGKRIGDNISGREKSK